MVSAVLTLEESKVPDLALRCSSERRLVNRVSASDAVWKHQEYIPQSPSLIRRISVPAKAVVPDGKV